MDRNLSDYLKMNIFILEYCEVQLLEYIVVYLVFDDIYRQTEYLEISSWMIILIHLYTY